jgi:hypothetical protein
MLFQKILMARLVAQMCDEWNVSIRRACRVLEFDTSTYHYMFRYDGVERRRDPPFFDSHRTSATDR